MLCFCPCVPSDDKDALWWGKSAKLKSLFPYVCIVLILCKLAYITSFVLCYTHTLGWKVWLDVVHWSKDYEIWGHTSTFCLCLYYHFHFSLFVSNTHSNFSLDWGFEPASPSSGDTFFYNPSDYKFFCYILWMEIKVNFYLHIYEIYLCAL